MIKEKLLKKINDLEEVENKKIILEQEDIKKIEIFSCEVIIELTNGKKIEVDVGTDLCPFYSYDGESFWK